MKSLYKQLKIFWLGVEGQVDFVAAKPEDFVAAKPEQKPTLYNTYCIFQKPIAILNGLVFDVDISNQVKNDVSGAGNHTYGLLFLGGVEENV